MHTPWGQSQHSTQIARGIVFYSTAGHGGFHLSDGRWKDFVSTWPEFKPFAGPQWFEEDCDATMVVVTFPECFKPEQVEQAKKQIQGMAERFLNTQYPAVWNKLCNAA